MRSRTTCTVVATIAVLGCFGIGGVIGLSATHQPDDQSTTALEVTATDPSATGAPADGTNVPGSPSDGANDGAASADSPAAGAGDQEGRDAPGLEDEGEQAPPEGEERPPAWDPQLPEPNLPQLPPPVWNPPNNDEPPPPPPAPPAQPLSVRVTRLGPGPIWESGWQRACNGSAMLTHTTVSVFVSEQPRATPFVVTATARVGNMTRNAVVQQEPGQPDRFVIGYGFPRGTVQRPSYPVITIEVRDANGNRASTSVGGHQGVGHTLYPADHCP